MKFAELEMWDMLASVLVPLPSFPYYRSLVPWYRSWDRVLACSGFLQRVSPLYER